MNWPLLERDSEALSRPPVFPTSLAPFAFIEETESCVIDLFTVMAGVAYPDLILDAEPGMIGEQAIRYASNSALIRLKSGPLREKNQIDVIGLKGMLEK